MKTNKKKNQLAAIAITAALLASPKAYSLSVDHASAAPAAKYKIIAQPFDIEGKKTSINTINKDGSTYIALRNVNTALQLSSNFDKAAQLVIVSGNGRTMKINMKTKAITLNGQSIFGPEVILQDNTTYLPFRFLLEMMGYEVTYTNSTKQVGVRAIKENDLQIQARKIGTDGDGKSLSVYYPVISGYAVADIQNKINAFLKQEADKHIAAGSKEMDQVVKGNNQLLAENPKADVRQPRLEGRFTVTYNEKGKLSMYVDYHIYTGGAHGLTARFPYTFDLLTGDLISLKNAAGNDDYVSIINRHIKEQIKSRGLELITPFHTIEANREYFLSHNGVTIYFTQYEYTSYANGMPAFIVPYSEFK
ncbi:PdaC/SigV domain-containing protein [Paenibacillus gansuensis]|uniref:PdaC/SigV domain-containing protein n=1 Tax=Paenibacillus gansuensis TaxID=306542 RepID=A0ABW5PJ26_9BACL